VKKEYTSKYGASGEITSAQFLTEFIMERIAAKDNKTLPSKFWSHSDWKKTFLAQINHANKLLKEASCIEIMAALRHKDLSRVYSLGLKRQILDKVAQLAKVNDITKEPLLSEPDWVLDESDTVEDKPINKLTSLWEKLNG